MNNSIVFPNLHITFNNVGQSISIFGFEIAYYGICIAIGMVLGALLILSEAKRVGISEDNMLDILMISVVFAIVGARIYYVAFSWDTYKDNLLSILDIRGGGLAIYGGLMAGILTGYIVCKVKKVKFLAAVDCATFGFLVGQSLGRWGNFFNREAFGQYTDSLFAMCLPFNSVRSSDVTVEMVRNMVTIDGTSYVSVHPTFLYESFLNLCILIFLLLYRKHKKFDGQIFCFYMIGYGVIRFFLEQLRTDQLLIANTNIPVSIVVSAVVAGGGLVLYLVLYLRKKNAKAKD